MIKRMPSLGYRLINYFPQLFQEIKTAHDLEFDNKTEALLNEDHRSFIALNRPSESIMVFISVCL